jgi:hypothetical protein
MLYDSICHYLNVMTVRLHIFMLCESAFDQKYGAEQVLTSCSTLYAQSKADLQNIKMRDLKKYDYLTIITFTQSVTHKII